MKQSTKSADVQYHGEYMNIRDEEEEEEETLFNTKGHRPNMYTFLYKHTYE